MIFALLIRVLRVLPLICTAQSKSYIKCNKYLSRTNILPKMYWVFPQQGVFHLENSTIVFQASRSRVKLNGGLIHNQLYFADSHLTP
jgi:hypothetical protein